jgi:GTP cyclohydrolase II
MTSLLAPSSAKIRRERSPRRTLSADSIAKGSRRSSPDGGTPQSLPHRFQIYQFAGATLASPEVQLASQRIRRVQFSVNAIPVRLHSACLTGNVFGSRRCDCGDQLRLALALLEDLGGGIILYLAQEARRLGLANKMRTYQSQDDGLDTFDANTTLGFDDDERDYSIAACMLRMLYRTRIGAHQQSGQAKRSHKGRIEIASRMPINADNRRYRSLDFRFEEFLRTRRAHVGLGDKGYPGIDIG